MSNKRIKQLVLFTRLQPSTLLPIGQSEEVWKIKQISILYLLRGDALRNNLPAVLYVLFILSLSFSNRVYSPHLEKNITDYST